MVDRDTLGTVESVRVACLWDTLVKKLLVQYAPVEDALAEHTPVEHTRTKDKTFRDSVGKGSKKASDFALETRDRSEK